MTTIAAALKKLNPPDESKQRDRSNPLLTRLLKSVLPGGDSSSWSIFENEDSSPHLQISEGGVEITLDFEEFIVAADKQDKALLELIEKISGFQNGNLVVKFNFNNVNTDKLVQHHPAFLKQEHPYWLLLKLGRQKAINFKGFFSSFGDATNSELKTNPQIIYELMRNALRANTCVEMIRLDDFKNREAICFFANIISNTILAHTDEKKYLLDETNPSFLRYLFFSGTAFSNEALSIIINAIPFKDDKFYSLAFEGCDITGEKFKVVAKALDNPMVKRLKLDSNSIGDDVRHLAEKLIGNQSLVKLWLRNNDIGIKSGEMGSQAIVRLAAALKKNNTLTDLYLGGTNQITKDDFIKLIDALRVNTKVNVHLSYKQVVSFCSNTEFKGLSEGIYSRIVVDGAPGGFRFGEKIPEGFVIKASDSDMVSTSQEEIAPKVATNTDSSKVVVKALEPASSSKTVAKAPESASSPKTVAKAPEPVSSSKTVAKAFEPISSSKTVVKAPKSTANQYEVDKLKAIAGIAGTTPLFNHAIKSNRKSSVQVTGREATDLPASTSGFVGVNALVGKLEEDKKALSQIKEGPMKSQTTGVSFVQPGGNNKNQQKRFK